MFEVIDTSKRITAESRINIAGRDVESLNGFWSFGIDQYDSCLRNGWYKEYEKDADGRPLPLDYSFDQWERVPVPSCWNMLDEKYFLYEGSAVYTRKFRYINRGEARVFLRFGAANYAAHVFLNRESLGVHYGGSTDFAAEVTDLLKEENRLLVVVNNTRGSSRVPMENTDWFNYGGLYRDVSLVRLPEKFIRDAAFSYRDGKIKVAADADGTVYIDELGIAQKFSKTAEIPARPELWSPENPKLYDVRVEADGDVFRDRVGFREIAVDGTKILLNGKEIYLRGVSAHEESAANGKAVTEEEIRETFAIAKEMNCNFMRLAHYPHTELAAKIADEIGLLLWEEVPVYWDISFTNPETYADAKNQLTELILRDRNRASVVIWSVGNENPDTDERFKFMSGLADVCRELDSTRLVSAACLVDHAGLKIADRLADKLDIIGVNEYYGWYEPDFSKLPRIFENSRPSKPVVISEFGADAKSGAHGTPDDMYTEENQLEVYRRQIETLRAIRYVRGMTPWILFDFRCPRRLHYMQNRYNPKGLLSSDKKHPKLAYYAMKSFYEEIRHNML
ncbi:beta-glucuronidase [Clostridia bacterium]|nr:beta-glucuronidase [Clostridia bacterium]